MVEDAEGAAFSGKRVRALLLAFLAGGQQVGEQEVCCVWPIPAKSNFIGLFHFGSEDLDKFRFSPEVVARSIICRPVISLILKEEVFRINPDIQSLGVSAFGWIMNLLRIR